MQRPILTIILLSLLLVLGTVFVWRPKYQEVQGLRFLVKEKRVQLQNKENYFSQLENLSRQLEERKSEIAKIESALPLSPGIPDLFNFISQISSRNGLILQKVGSEEMPLSEEEKILKTTLSFSLSGTYPGFKNFLSELEKSSRLIGVQRISFSTPPPGQLFSFDLQITVNSY